MKKICKNCNGEFETNKYNKKYCSYSCERGYNEKNRKLKPMKICSRCKIKPTQSSRAKYCFDCFGEMFKVNENTKNQWNKKYQLEYHYKHRDEYDYKMKRNERFKKYWRKRYDEDIQFRVAQRLRNLLNWALFRYTKTGKTFSSKKYGIDYKAIIEHLKPFPKNINEMHIDHIIPLSKFNLEDPLEVKKAFSPENLQWLPGFENIAKSNKVNWKSG